MKSYHEPVLTEETINGLQPRFGDDFIDCTLGGGGHAKEILNLTSPNGRLLGIDLDPKAIAAASSATKEFKNRTVFVQDNFKNIAVIAEEQGFDQVAGILLDIGLSSGQLDDKTRGFSFTGNSKLDMRFGPELKMTAADIVNKYSLIQLTEIFKNYGEERLAKPIAERIIAERKIKPLETTEELVAIADEVYKIFYHHESKMNPATKMFQALRMAVNDELGNLEKTLPQAVKLLKSGGRLAIISFHSLEDRIVKDYFKTESRDCLCPPERPTCQCGHKKTLKILTKKPIIADFAELAKNPRARSAKLRLAEKI